MNLSGSALTDHPICTTSLLILRDACPANYQQEAVPAAGPGGGGGGYAPANPYDDRSNANIINRGGYSTQPYG